MGQWGVSSPNGKDPRLWRMLKSWGKPSNKLTKGIMDKKENGGRTLTFFRDVTKY